MNAMVWILMVLGAVISLVKIWAHICTLKEIKAQEARAAARRKPSGISISVPGQGWVQIEGYKS